jgi:hypothetical protein
LAFFDMSMMISADDDEVYPVQFVAVGIKIASFVSDCR